MKHIVSLEELDQFVKANPVVMVELGADWCKPCKDLEPVLEGLQKTHQVVIVKMDVQRVEGVQERFNVMNLPTLILYRDGQMVNALGGKRSQAVIVSHFSLAYRNGQAS